MPCSQKFGAQKLIDLYLKCENAVGFLTSLHGKDSKTHNIFVESGEKSFDTTIQNIRQATNSGLDIFTNTVITNKNFAQIPEILDLTHSLGVKYSVFNRFQAINHPLLPTEEQLLKAIETVQKQKKQGSLCRIGNNIPACFYPLSNFPATAGYELCHISPQGNLRPDNLTAYQLGNILNLSLAEIWKNNKSQMYRESIPMTCFQCAALQSCRGGAKSLYFMHTTAQSDTLMKGILNVEQTQSVYDDKEKKAIQILALTSD